MPNGNEMNKDHYYYCTSITNNNIYLKESSKHCHLVRCNYYYSIFYCWKNMSAMATTVAGLVLVSTVAAVMLVMCKWIFVCLYLRVVSKLSLLFNTVTKV